MKRLFACLPILAAVLLPAPPVAAQPTTPAFVADGENVAQRLVAFALRTDVAANDPRVVQARDWLARAAKATGEDEPAVAASCVRAARYFRDLTHTAASPLEPLEAIAKAAKPGQAMSDVMMAYIEARRQAPNKSHAEALTAIGVKR